MSAAYELRIVRMFDAPRELVWKAWTDPAMAMRWMGPRGFTAMECSAAGEPGAAWRMVMEGQMPPRNEVGRLTQGGRTLECVPPEKLVFTFAWDKRASVGLGESPYRENIVTVLLEECDGKTQMTFTQAPFATEGERDGHTGGWNSSFDRFAEFLLGEQAARKPEAEDAQTKLHERRWLAAARQSVFDAWTKAELLAQWWGPEGFRSRVCELDAQGGGSLLVEMLGPDGSVHPMSGKFLEVYAPHRCHFICSPLDREGQPVFALWTSVFLAEKDGGTELTLDAHVMEQTVAAPDYLKGLGEGWRQSLDKLQRLVEQDRRMTDGARPGTRFEFNQGEAS